MPNDLLTILLGHNDWATRLLIERSRELTHAQLHQRFDIGPGSMHDTLRHVVGCMFRWADRIAARPVRPSIEDDGTERTPDDLAALLTTATAELTAVAAGVESQGRLGEPMRFETPEGTVYTFTRGAALLHVLTHGVHHRAQVLNMRRRLGLPSIGLDLDPIEWECVRTGQIV